MPHFLTQSTLYKGLFILILAFVALEYIFNSISDTRTSTFNTTRPAEYSDKPLRYGSVLYKRILENNSTEGYRHHVNLDISNLDYVVTVPPFLVGNVTTTYIPVLKSQVISPLVQREQHGIIANETKPLCPDISQSLFGKVQIKKSPVPSIEQLERRLSWLQYGGHWQPPNCIVEQKVAIVIPYRSRAEHLLLFLQHMHPFLRKQQLDYTIFVVEQDGDGPFNRATLMNIGYIEALKSQRYDCFIFHDVDLLPEDDRNLYECPHQPRHMSVAVDMFNYRLPYPAIFGGVSAISTEHFQLLNGFSNSFWGWGGEDDDMSNRIRYHHLYISRYPITIARYTMLSHKKDYPNPIRYELLKKGQKLFDKDGLNNLTYELLLKRDNLLYTWILVKLTPPHS